MEVDLDSEYDRMAADEGREAEAREWADALLSDVADEAPAPDAAEEHMGALPTRGDV